MRERAEEEVSWRRAVELLLAGSLPGTVENTPSRRCGVEADKELVPPAGANLIQEMGQRLNVYPFILVFPLPPCPLIIRPAAGPGAARTWRRRLGLCWASAVP